MKNSFLKFFNSYTNKLNFYLKNIDEKNLSKLEIFFRNLVNSKKIIFITGNGVSAATANVKPYICSLVSKIT